MKKETARHIRFQSISDAHRHFNLPAPKHPLISLVCSADTCMRSTEQSGSHVLGFYKISYRPRFTSKLKYGQHYYDFDEGGLLFAAPGQLLGRDSDNDTPPDDTPLYTLLIHPDFLLQYPLAKKIKSYGFFSYSANEALHLSADEKETIVALFKMMEQELEGRIDASSQPVIIAQIELLCNYADRYYKRQFITRKAASSDILQKLEEITLHYFASDLPGSQGLPTVAYLAAQLNLSPSYLSDMLRSLTGQTAQQYIHSQLIEQAKQQLSATNLSVAEIAYMLGFEHPQSFNKLFKSKTDTSPLEFRRSFN